MADYQLQWQAGTDSEPARLVLSGRIDFANCIQAVREGERLLKSNNGAGRICLDVGGVENAQSVLLSVLMRWLAMVDGSKAEVSVAGLSGQMFEVARVSGVETVLPLVS